MKISQPTGDILTQILQNHIREYSEFHKCIYEEDTIQAAIAIAQSIDGSFPDKALTILDKAGSLVRIRSKEPHPRVTAADIRNLVYPRKSQLDREIEQCIQALGRLICIEK